MKNLKTIQKMLPLLLLVTFASCKKDKKNEPETPPITADDLLGHYITLTINGAPSLRRFKLISKSNEVNFIKSIN